MSATLFTSSKYSATDAAGLPLASGLVYTYAAGSLTPQATYTSQSGASPNTNPVVLDSSGRANIWLGPYAYRFIVKSAAGVLMPDGDTDNITNPVASVQLTQPTTDLMVGDGVTTIYTLSANPANVNNVLFSLGGAIQVPTVDYTLSGVVITCTAPPPVGVVGFFNYTIALPVGTNDASLINFSTQTTYPAGTVGSKLRESVSVLDFIPASEYAAIKAYTSTLDVTDYFNAALAASAVVRVPAGGYRTLYPINMSARRTANGFSGRRLIGEGADKVQINAYTGVYPCIDCTGQSTGEVSGINFRSDNPPVGLTAANCASIGLQMGRGNIAQQCNQLTMFDLRFNLTSDMTRNAGNGTIGICNDASEHCIADRVQIYANLPLVSHNVMQFVIARSASIATKGVAYEQPYTGAAISCTIHEWRNMQLIAWDSFRAMWLHQVAGVEFPNLYTSTRRLASLLPAQKESFYLSGASANVMIRCYQEVSGLFGSTYRMDHRFLTLDGSHQGLNVQVQRGVSDFTFTLPATPESSVMLLNAAYLNDSVIDCNYLSGNYNASGDNLGFANEAIAVTGTPNSVRNTKFVLDSVFSRTGAGNIFNTIGAFSFNVDSINFLSGASYYGSQKGSFVPVAIGLTTAGAVTYTFQAGYFSRSGRTVHFVASLGWSAHSGTGGMAITGLPFISDVNVFQAVSVQYDGFTVGAGKQLVAAIQNNQTRVILNQADPAGGALLGAQVDTVVASLIVSGTYLIA